MDDNLKNRIWNSSNPAQGPWMRTLILCSAGLLRSPTTAFVLSQEPYNRNVRPAGTEESFALIPVNEVLLAWAQELVFVSPRNYDSYKRKFKEKTSHAVYVLNIPDAYEFRDPVLIDFVKRELVDKGIPYSSGGNPSGV